MTTKLLAGRKHVWPAITRALRQGKGPSHVAVAYVGKGSAQRLPLKSGSWLVVDASAACVASGRTHPEDLAWLRKHRHVRVFNREHLHAKVFVTTGVALVGSANASGQSAELLDEAVMVTTATGAVAAARRFVRSLCTAELGPVELKRLQKLYRPPKVPRRGKSTLKRRAAVGPKLRIEQLQPADPPAGSEKAQQAGRKAARKRMEAPRSHEIDGYWTPGHEPVSFQDRVIQVVSEEGRDPYVLPLGTVVGKRRWRLGGRSCTFVYLELPKGQRTNLKRMAKRVGHGGLAALKRRGWVPARMREKMLRAMVR